MLRACHTHCLILLIIICGFATAALADIGTQPQQAPPTGQNQVSYTQMDLVRDAAAADALVDRIPVTEILGPLAPIALSPFFGLACLSGASLLMDQGLLPNNSMLSGNAILSHPAVFAALLAMAIFTSLPRLTKVSKLLAQVTDFIETHAGIATYLLIICAATVKVNTACLDLFFTTAPDFCQAGVLSITATGFILITCALNLLIVITVRSFFELLILICPIPAVDALFEVGNKAFCLGLIALYLFSPIAATVLSLLVFLICLVAFRWVKRRVTFYQGILLEPVAAAVYFRFFKGSEAQMAARGDRAASRLGRGKASTPLVKVVPNRKIGAIKPRASCYLGLDGQGVFLVCPRFLQTPLLIPINREDYQLKMTLGVLLNNIEFYRDGDNAPIYKMTFPRHYAERAQQLAGALGASFDEAAAKQLFRDWSNAFQGGLRRFNSTFSEGIQAMNEPKSERYI